ncbi:MAG: hypothetical protein ACK521_00310 [bacterium]
MSKCKSISSFHAVLNYDFDQEIYGIIAIDNFSLNGATVTS